MYFSFNSDESLPVIKLFSSSHLFSTGLVALVPDAKWHITPLPYYFRHFRVEYAAYYAIALADCSPLDIIRTLQWLRCFAYQFPVLLLVDEMTPLIHQQTLGTNAVVIVTKTSLQNISKSVLLWLSGKLGPRTGQDKTDYLCRREWDTLNRYLLVHDMHAVAAWMNISIKRAYYWRMRALKKLGFNHINEFLRFYTSYPEIQILPDLNMHLADY